MQAYSMDLRQRVLAASDAGLPTKPVAEKYGVSRTWVRSLKQRRRETGEIAPRVGGGRKRKIDRVKLVELVEAQPDAVGRRIGIVGRVKGCNVPDGGKVLLGPLRNKG